MKIYLKFLDILGNIITKKKFKTTRRILGKSIDIENKSKEIFVEQVQKKNININNNITTNNNQRTLSFFNHPKLMNCNNINQLSGKSCFISFE